MSEYQVDQDTIVAITTAQGIGSVGVIRVSGALCLEIAKKLLNLVPKPRYAHYVPFLDETNNVIDKGIALYFPKPHSFTGEDVLEIQGHGGSIILDLVLTRILQCGARQAKPGEFSQRAFLNDKIDLAQAEAIADLIEASSSQAARSAIRSMQGLFSQKVNELVESLIQLRMYVEASIDFPEEEVDFLTDGNVSESLNNIFQQLSDLIASSKQGIIQKEGMKLVIAGQPNVGKSSILNCLCGRDVAIVTDIEGTTRDALREHINIDGMPIHITDTAGLRNTNDVVEQKGIERAIKEIEQADKVLLVRDASKEKGIDVHDFKLLFNHDIPLSKLIILYNKIDLVTHPLEINSQDIPVLQISAKESIGFDKLRSYLKKCMDYQDNPEGFFSARRRHLDALNRTKDVLIDGIKHFEYSHSGELLAEDLRHGQIILNEITGQFTSDDLLGRIFSSFCIGK